MEEEVEREKEGLFCLPPPPRDGGGGDGSSFPPAAEFLNPSFLPSSTEELLLLKGRNLAGSIFCFSFSS